MFLKVLLLFVLFVAQAVFLRRARLRGEKQLAALIAWYDASKVFTDWRLRNQGVYIGLSEEGRMLLGRNLDAYDWFLKTHKFIDGKEHREWLVNLFYDFPPKHPDEQDPTEKRGVLKDAPFFIISNFDKIKI
jgi:hypothetical protein